MSNVCRETFRAAELCKFVFCMHPRLISFLRAVRNLDVALSVPESVGKPGK